MKGNINNALGNLDMDTTLEKYVLTQKTSTIKQLAETNKILMEEIKTLEATNVCLKVNGINH